MALICNTEYTRPAPPQPLPGLRPCTSAIPGPFQPVPRCTPCHPPPTNVVWVHWPPLRDWSGAGGAVRNEAHGPAREWDEAGFAHYEVASWVNRVAPVASATGAAEAPVLPLASGVWGV